MGFSLQELGYRTPLDDKMAEDLIYLENCINEKRKKDMENSKYG